MKAHSNHTWLEEELYRNGDGAGAQVALVFSWIIYVLAYIGEWTVLLQLVISVLCLIAWILQRKPGKLDGYLIEKENINIALKSICKRSCNDPNIEDYKLMREEEWGELNKIMREEECKKLNEAMSSNNQQVFKNGGTMCNNNQQAPESSGKSVINNRTTNSQHASGSNEKSVIDYAIIVNKIISIRNNDPEIIALTNNNVYRRLTVRAEMRIWQRSVRQHFKTVGIAALSVMLMMLTKYNNPHAYTAWSLIVNIVATAYMIVIIWGFKVIYFAMLIQIIIFYRMLSWEKLCEGGYRVLSTIKDASKNEDIKYDIRPVKSTISGSESTEHYYELKESGRKVESTGCKRRASLSLRRVGLAKVLHSQALKEEKRVADNLDNTIYGLFAVLAILAALMVLPGGYDTTVDVLYATTLAVQASTLVTAASAVMGWSNAARTYTEACWMLELANNRFITSEAQNYKTHVTDLYKKRIKLVYNTVFVNHTLSNIPELGIP